MDDWSAWVGRNERRSDRLTPALAARWLAAFDLTTQADGAMPQGIHFCLCTPDAPTAELGEDGHPARNDTPDSFFPPVPLPRRMWAASSIEFLSPISIGAAVERISRIVSVTPKSGRSGEMVFVEVSHETHADDALAVRETQTLVYREAAAPDAPLQPSPSDARPFAAAEWQAHRTVVPTAPLLFRFSALTFNTHRIHYDLPYARDVERYRGLVVHGPLMASLLLQLSGPLQRFSFRATSPAISGEALHLAMREEDGTVTLGAFSAEGRQVISADGRR